MILALAVAALLAHHSFAADFDITKPVVLTGAVVKIEWLNPHVHVYIDVKAQQRVERWNIEMGSPNGLGRQGWTSKTMKIGDMIIVGGSLAKDGSRFANARVITLPSGRRLSAAPPGGKTS